MMILWFSSKSELVVPKVFWMCSCSDHSPGYPATLKISGNIQITKFLKCPLDKASAQDRNEGTLTQHVLILWTPLTASLDKIHLIKISLEWLQGTLLIVNSCVFKIWFPCLFLSLYSNTEQTHIEHLSCISLILVMLLFLSDLSVVILSFFLN